MKISLTDKQKRALSEGKSVRLKASQLSNGDITLDVSPVKLKKYEKAKRLNKGITLSLSQPEYKKSITSSGGKLTWAGFKRGAKKVGNKIRDSFREGGVGKKFGKEVLKGLANAAIGAVGTAAFPEIGVAAPALAVVAKNAASKAIDGLGATQIRPSRIGVVRGGELGAAASGTFSNFLGPDHPAQHVADNRLPDNTGIKHGGSFKPAGGYGLRGSGFYGTPNNPGAPHSDMPLRM